VDNAIDTFTARWPASSATLSAGKLARGDTPVRIYEVAVAEWILFDEANFPEQPRQVLRAERLADPTT
jgi:hypothetical protein